MGRLPVSLPRFSPPFCVFGWSLSFLFFCGSPLARSFFGVGSSSLSEGESESDLGLAFFSSFLFFGCSFSDFSFLGGGESCLLVFFVAFLSEDDTFDFVLLSSCFLPFSDDTTLVDTTSPPDFPSLARRSGEEASLSAESLLLLDVFLWCAFLLFSSLVCFLGLLLLRELLRERERRGEELRGGDRERLGELERERFFFFLRVSRERDLFADEGSSFPQASSKLGLSSRSLCRSCWFRIVIVNFFRLL